MLMKSQKSFPEAVCVSSNKSRPHTGPPTCLRPRPPQGPFSLPSKAFLLSPLHRPVVLSSLTPLVFEAGRKEAQRSSNPAPCLNGQRDRGPETEGSLPKITQQLDG